MNLSNLKTKGFFQLMKNADLELWILDRTQAAKQSEKIIKVAKDNGYEINAVDEMWIEIYKVK